MHENELVYVYFGRLESEPKPDPAEVAEVALSCEEIIGRIERDPGSFAYWLKHYFHAHGAEIARWRRRRTVTVRCRHPRVPPSALTATGREITLAARLENPEAGGTHDPTVGCWRLRARLRW